MILAAIDIGGTSSRLVLFEPGDDAQPRRGPAIRVGATGIDASGMVREILRTAESDRLAVGMDQPDAVVVGMSGLLGLVDVAADVRAVVRSIWPGARTSVASDAVTAAVGALGMTGGAVVAAGTGVVGFGTDFASHWHRVDGWGHVLGDEGGGAWIGSTGLREGLRAHDGRGGSKALLDALRARFGAPESLPRQIYTRDDRAGVLASFAPDVAAAAAAGDPVAGEIIERAVERLAETAVACLEPGVPRRVALVGGLRSIGEPLTSGFARTVSRVGDVDIVEPFGDPLAGAAVLAHLLATDPGAVPHQPPFITTEAT